MAVIPDCCQANCQACGRPIHLSIRADFSNSGERTFIVGVGDGSVDLQRIMHVGSVASSDGITYIVLSKDSEDMDTKLIIVFKNDEGGQFQLGNERGIIWKRCKGEQCGIEDKLLLEKAPSR